MEILLCFHLKARLFVPVKIIVFKICFCISVRQSWYGVKIPSRPRCRRRSDVSGSPFHVDQTPLSPRWPDPSAVNGSARTAVQEARFAFTASAALSNASAKQRLDLHDLSGVGGFGATRNGGLMQRIDSSSCWLFKGLLVHNDAGSRYYGRFGYRDGPSRHGDVQRLIYMKSHLQHANVQSIVESEGVPLSQSESIQHRPREDAVLVCVWRERKGGTLF